MTTHFFHYLVLFLILAFGLGGLWSSSSRPGVQFFLIIFTALAYILWGMIHHFLEKSLNLKVVVEYILVAALVVTLWQVLKGSL